MPSHAIAANGTGGYYEFINRVRSDYVPATTLRRLGGWLDWLRATDWSKERLANWLSVRGFKHIIVGGPYGGEPWLGENTNWSWYLLYMNTSAAESHNNIILLIFIYAVMK